MEVPFILVVILFIYFLKGTLFLLIYLCIYFWLLWVFLAARAFSSCSERGPPLAAVCRLLIAVASLVVEHRLQARRLSSCGARA